jgi:type I restriction enzyme S subunit
MSSELARFGDLFEEPQRNGLTRPKKVRGSGLPMVNMGELFAYPRIRNIRMDLVPIDDKEHHYLLQPNDLLFARQSLVLSGAGQCSIFLGNDAPTVFESHLIRCRLSSIRSNPLFYFYFFRSPDGRRAIDAIVEQGAGASGIRGSDLVNVQVPNPPKQVQDEVAGLLGSLDDRITLLRETNTTLEAIAQALFKSWFVDFDPVHAKMQGRAPDGMDQATAALFPDSFEDSELGAVPMGWRLVPFGQLLSHTIGGDWGSDVPDEKNDTRVAIIRGTDIPDLQTNANSRVPVRYTSQKKLAGRKLEDGDLLLEVSGGSKDQPTGRSLFISAALLSQFDCPVEPASFCRLLRPVNKEVGMLLAQHLTYIYAQGKTWEYQNQSTGIANFQTTHFLETELVACPPDDVLKAFAETVQPLIARAHLTQIQELASLRDVLLPKLISGQLAINDEKLHLEM